MKLETVGQERYTSQVVSNDNRSDRPDQTGPQGIPTLLRGELSSPSAELAASRRNLRGGSTTVLGLLIVGATVGLGFYYLRTHMPETANAPLAAPPAQPPVANPVSTPAAAVVAQPVAVPPPVPVPADTAPVRPTEAAPPVVAAPPVSPTLHAPALPALEAPKAVHAAAPAAAKKIVHKASAVTAAPERQLPHLPSAPPPDDAP